MSNFQDTLPLPSPTCQAIVDKAVLWVITCVQSLPEAQQRVQGWDEYPGILAHEKQLDAACLSGSEKETAAAAKQYCGAWQSAIKSHRKNTKKET